jgi:phenylalanyl-tRNA synthetase alpha chain
MEMGFDEMPTNKWVESSFWNFDSLFQPQSHPARDAHDTFFIKEPASTISVPEEYYERVKEMHEKGGSGSIGYRYDFQRKEAMKNLLRTHSQPSPNALQARQSRGWFQTGAVLFH